jgi:hypothetical protein
MQTHLERFAAPREGGSFVLNAIRCGESVYTRLLRYPYCGAILGKVVHPDGTPVSLSVGV